MSRQRKTSADRRAEIIAATLELLAHEPIDALTTRQIAKKIGLSQPALFRHFHSREKLLVAVVEHIREQLATIADQALAQHDQPIERLRGLAMGLMTYVQAHPGLANVLFAPHKKGAVVDALRQQVAAQIALVSELVREAQRRDTLRADLNAEQAAEYFVAMLQGTVLRHRLVPKPDKLVDAVTPMIALWFDGTARHEATRKPVDDEHGRPDQAAQTLASARLGSLDVRPIFASGRDPLEDILQAVAAIRPGGALTITAPFRPTPLLRLLRERGHDVVVRQLDQDTWSIDVLVQAASKIDELMDLEPPEPLEQILSRADKLPAQSTYLARVPRFPRMLVTELEQRGVCFEICEANDGSALVCLWRSDDQ